MRSSPKIGITMRLETATDRFYLGRDYSEAVEHFGAIPVHLGLIPKKRYIEEALSDLDGLLLPGSDSDVDPHAFGEEPHPNLKNVIPVKDQTDALVLRVAEQRNIPILAICYGMQALNVARGGNLIQDIATQLNDVVKHEQGVPLARDSHSLTIDPGSLIASLATSKDARVNSHHHQAVRKIGKNLRATAWAKDGVVECIEDTRSDRFVLGVQWHPELSWKNNRFSANVFRCFVAAAGKFWKNKGKEQIHAKWTA